MSVNTMLEYVPGASDELRDDLASALASVSEGITRMTTDISHLTLEQKASLLSGRDFWSTKPIEEAGIPSLVLTDGPHGIRRQAGDADHLGINDSLPSTCFPPAVAVGSSWDPDMAARVGTAVGEEGLAFGVAVVLGPGSEHQTVPAVRKKLRVLLRRPLPLRGPRRSPRQRAASSRPGCVGEALRGQQPGDRADAHQRRRGRAHVARNLPAGLRTRRHRGQPRHRDVLLQQGQRGVRVPQPLAPHRRPARRLGIHRRGRLRLGCRQRPSGKRSGPAWTWRCPAATAPPTQRSSTR